MKLSNFVWSLINNKNFLQTDGTAQSPYVSCSYSDIVIEGFNKKALQYHPSVISWKRFRDDVFLDCLHSREEPDLFFNYMNNIDSTRKNQLTMEVAKYFIDFPDLRLKFDKESKRISVDIFSKTTNNFTYVPSSTCFPKNIIENIPKGVALHLRRMCDSDSKC